MLVVIFYQEKLPIRCFLKHFTWSVAHWGNTIPNHLQAFEFWEQHPGGKEDPWPRMRRKHGQSLLLPQTPGQRKFHPERGWSRDYSKFWVLKWFALFRKINIPWLSLNLDLEVSVRYDMRKTREAHVHVTRVFPRMRRHARQQLLVFGRFERVWVSARHPGWGWEPPGKISSAESTVPRGVEACGVSFSMGSQSCDALEDFSTCFASMHFGWRICIASGCGTTWETPCRNVILFKFCPKKVINSISKFFSKFIIYS